MASAREFHLESQFVASLEEVDRFCMEVRAALAASGLTVGTFYVELITREMLNNAVLHGCSGRLSGQVRCDLSIIGGALTLEVIDDGPGFDWRRAMKEAEDVSPLATSGRGLRLLRKLCHSVVLNSAGNGVRVCRELGL